MTRLNLLREPGCWIRLILQARRSRSMTNDATARALHSAVLRMYDEQRSEGLKAGVTMCEFDGCACVATHRWIRTAADLKAMRRKHKGTWLQGEPESTRCETHIPDWLAPKYHPLSLRDQLAA